MYRTRSIDQIGHTLVNEGTQEGRIPSDEIQSLLAAGLAAFVALELMVMMTSGNDKTPGPCPCPGPGRLDAQPTNRDGSRFV